MIPEQVRALSREATDALRRIEPTITEMKNRLYPCEVVTDDGVVHPRVYVMDANAYLKEWGVWPWAEKGKDWVPAERITSLRSSPHRLPPRFANVIMAAGESGMGYCAFVVELRDGRWFHYAMGNAVDFPLWPEGVVAEDVVAVHPHARFPEHRDRAPRADESSARFAWCPFRA